MIQVCEMLKIFPPSLLHME